MSPLRKQFLCLRDCEGWVEVLWTGLRAIENGMTTVQSERILELIETFACRLVACIDYPPIRGQ